MPTVPSLGVSPTSGPGRPHETGAKRGPGMIGTRAGSGTARRRAARAWAASAARAWAACVVTAALLVAMAACGRGAPVPVEGASRSGSAMAGPGSGAGALTVLSASFVSGSVGWLLATPCADQVATCRTVVMRETADGGRTWFAVPAPDAPPADMFQGSPPANAVGAVVFTGGGEGWAFGPALRQTRDGGATWQKMSGPGGPVQDLAVAGDRVLAATGRCGMNRWTCGFRVYEAAAGSDDWRAVPGAAGTGVGSARLVVSGGVGYVFATTADLGPPVLLAGPVNGSARWRPVPVPCRGAWSGALAAALGGWLFLGCGLEPSAGNQFKTAWVSGDGGRDWREVASPPFGGYLQDASMSPGGTIFLSGGRMDIYVSWDRGRGWHESPSLENAANLAGAGFSLTGSIMTDTRGFAVQEGAGQQQIWITSDGGRDWTPVTVR